MKRRDAQRSRRRASRGLTLIEIVIALLIVALLFSAVVMSVGAITGTKAKAAASELAGVIRSLYDTAALSGKTCRLVFELPEPESDEVTTYRAECAAGNITTSRDRDAELRDTQEEKKEARAPRGDGPPSLADMMSQEKDRVEEAARFSGFTTEELAPRDLPSSVRLSVWTRHQREAAVRGPAFLYFFPQGFTERAQVVVSQGDNAWTLKVSSLTGKVSIVGEALEVPRS